MTHPTLLKPNRNHVQPRSVYLHIPFCASRCGYCNFTLIANRADLIPSFLAALESELRLWFPSAREELSPLPLDTLYLGGGTPSQLTESQLESCFRLLRHYFSWNAETEVTAEVNPLDCTDSKLACMRGLGVNRLSIGGQSFSNTKLRSLERDHSGQQLSDCIRQANHFIDNLSLDLIFAAPSEALVDWRRDIKQALEHPVKHLSCYGLTIEKGSAFFGRVHRGALAELSDDAQAEMYTTAIDELERAGWEHYEVSSFCAPVQPMAVQSPESRQPREHVYGHQEQNITPHSLKTNRSRHNQVYWEGQPWYAFGPGASSYLPSALISDQIIAKSPPGDIRMTNHRSVVSYIRRVMEGRSPVAEYDVLDVEQRLREQLVFGLRRLEGVDLESLSEAYGLPVRQLFEPTLSTYIEHGWLADSGSRLRLTRQGLLISDGLWPDLLSR